MASTSGGIQNGKGPGNELLELAHLKKHPRRAVCLTTKFVIDFWRLFDSILMGFVLFDQSKPKHYGNRLPYATVGKSTTTALTHFEDYKRNLCQKDDKNQTKYGIKQ